MSVSSPLGTADYLVSDEFFGRPYIDVDEWRAQPAPHRQVHGGFEGTDTRFTFYFPPDASYQGRMYCLVESRVDGDVHATSRRLPNLASARVVVT